MSGVLVSELLFTSSASIAFEVLVLYIIVELSM